MRCSRHTLGLHSPARTAASASNPAHPSMDRGVFRTCDSPQRARPRVLADPASGGRAQTEEPASFPRWAAAPAPGMRRSGRATGAGRPRELLPRPSDSLKFNGRYSPFRLDGSWVATTTTLCWGFHRSLRHRPPSRPLWSVAARPSGSRVCLPRSTGEMRMPGSLQVTPLYARRRSWAEPNRGWGLGSRIYL